MFNLQSKHTVWRKCVLCQLDTLSTERKQPKLFSIQYTSIVIIPCVYVTKCGDNEYNNMVYTICIVSMERRYHTK